MARSLHVLDMLLDAMSAQSTKEIYQQQLTISVIIDPPFPDIIWMFCQIWLKNIEIIAVIKMSKLLPWGFFDILLDKALTALWHNSKEFKKKVDYTYIDSNRRVGVWSPSGRWHSLSIPLTKGRRTDAETCGLDDVFPPDDLCSRLETIYIYINIYALLHAFCFLWFTNRFFLSDDNSLIAGCLWRTAKTWSGAAVAEAEDYFDCCPIFCMRK